MKKQDQKALAGLKWDLGIPELLPEWKALFSRLNLQRDLIAGITVACIAIPLSLAIALASGVPPAVGLSTAIIGGIVCALFGGTPLSVSGPAAAMAVLVSATVQKQGLDGLIFVVLASGVMQVLSGILGLGKLIRFVPLPVIAGFTAGIGAIILVGQLPTALGLPTPDQSHVLYVLSHVKGHIGLVQFESLSLSMGTLMLTLLLPRLSRKIPAPLVAVAVMTLVSVVFGLDVKLIGSIPRELPMPKFPTLGGKDPFDLIQTAFIFFTLASLETLLSSSAVDKLSGSKKHSPNQELLGQGLGNIASALFGGMPVTGVIARSTLNVQSGGKTRRAAIFHSLVILAGVFALAPWIEKIPVPVLSGILFSIALRMLHPRELIHVWHVSRIETLVYAITFGAIVFVGLISGVQTGITAALVILAIRLGQIQSGFHESELAGPYRFSITGPATFMSSGKIEAIRDQIDQIEPGRGVIIDLSRVTSIDSSGADQILAIVETILDQGSQIALQGLSERCQRVLKASDPRNRIASTFAATESEVHRIIQGQTSPNAIDRLIFGVDRFKRDSRLHYQNLFDQLSQQQDPHTLFITCSDSRISPTLITSTEPGELFVVRNVGNIIPQFGRDNTPAEVAAVEFSVDLLGVKDIVICGHSGCGAIKAIIDAPDLSRTPALKAWLESAVDIRSRFLAGKSFDDMARLNVLVQLEHLKTYPLVQKKLGQGELRLHGWFYNIGLGEIEEWEPKSNSFIPIGSFRTAHTHEDAEREMEKIRKSEAKKKKIHAIK